MKKKYIVTQTNGGSLITLQFPNKRELKVREGDVIELDLNEYTVFKHVFTSLDEHNKKLKERLKKSAENMAEHYKNDPDLFVVDIEYSKPKENQPIPEGKLPEEVKEPIKEEKIKEIIEDLKSEEKIIEKIKSVEVERSTKDTVPYPAKIDFDLMTYKELKTLCSENNLESKGKKSILIDRLEEHFAKDN